MMTSQSRFAILFVLALLCSALALPAQWVGMNPISTVSMVGIGTAMPQNFLHIHTVPPGQPTFTQSSVLRFSQGETCTGGGRLFLNPVAGLFNLGQQGDFILWANGINGQIGGVQENGECGRNLVLGATHDFLSENYGMIRMITGDGNGTSVGATEKMSVFSQLVNGKQHSIVDIKNGASVNGNSLLRFYESDATGLIDDANVGWTVGLDASSGSASNSFKFAFGSNPEFNNTQMALTRWGNLGLSVEIPNAKLHMRQNQQDWGSWISMEDNQGTFGYSFWKYDQKNVLSLSAYDLSQGGSWQWDIMAFTLDGRVGIGTHEPTQQVHINVDGTNTRVLIGADRNNPQTHNDAHLMVGGKILATELVITQEGWADFVFADDYELMPLEELEKAIASDRHLPGIPSEAEVKENGVSQSKLNTALLQKVEELTLYLIEMNKQNAELRDELNAVKDLLN